MPSMTTATSFLTAAANQDESGSTLDELRMIYMEEEFYLGSPDAKEEMEWVVNGTSQILVSKADVLLHWMQEGLFFSKKTWKYCDGVLKYFTMFAHTGCRKDYFFQKNLKIL